MKTNKDKIRKVVVIGDVWVDNILVPISGKTTGNGNSTNMNWRKQNRLEMFTVSGGALIIKDIINVLPNNTGKIEILSYKDIKPENLSNLDIIHSLVEGELAPDKENTSERYYIKRFIGYPGQGPENGVPAFAKDFTLEPDEDIDLIIIDDAGSGFRDVETSWMPVLDNAEKNKNVVIIYNMSGPLFSGKLWEAISQKNLLNRTILIIAAEALRNEGVNISRKLSWDRTIADFVTILAYKKLDQLEKCPHILVRFGLEGVMVYNHDIETKEEKTRNAGMFYIPNFCEDEIPENIPGKMNGLTSAFAGFLARQVIENKGASTDIPEVIANTVPPAMEQVIRLLKSGYQKESNRLQYPLGKVLAENLPGEIKTLYLPNQNTGYLENSRKNWNILSHQIPLDYHLKDIAQEYVVNGRVKQLENVPMVQFGKLLTIDKNEIENFRGIKNLVKEYLEDVTLNKPLPIAVFGPPGSGKSFAVKSVANSVMGSVTGKKAEVLEYNISQFESPLDIVRVFHEVRDYSLKGTIPLVFFDEFDSSYKGEPLGWLKYFLAPMQDGEFKEGEKTHPIGRAILVFAGGTSPSLRKFSRESEAKNPENGEDFQRFIAAKGPDFVSRLKGYVNILGPNPIDMDNSRDIAPRRDRFFIIRRAVLLRALLLQQKNIMAEKDRILIDEDVLRALLIIPKYKHGARSMAAIINMSMLSNRGRFEKAALPSPEQLRLHVDADVFINILDRDLIIKVADIPRAIHETYLLDQEEKSKTGDSAKPTMPGWDDLPGDIKQLNRMLAGNIPYYLLLLNCSYRPKTGNQNRENHVSRLTDEEIEYIAQMAHERWHHEKRSNGWTYGERKDDSKKLHNCIRPWEQLPEKDKGVDRKTVKSLPRILDKAGFEIYRLE